MSVYEKISAARKNMDLEAWVTFYMKIILLLDINRIQPYHEKIGFR